MKQLTVDEVLRGERWLTGDSEDQLLYTFTIQLSDGSSFEMDTTNAEFALQIDQYYDRRWENRSIYVHPFSEPIKTPWYKQPIFLGVLAWFIMERIFP